jgi:hypothetical protein
MCLVDLALIKQSIIQLCKSAAKGYSLQKWSGKAREIWSKRDVMVR